MMVDVDDFQSAESIYRKYIESALRVVQQLLVSPETGLVHLSSMSDTDIDGYADAIPLEENILYILLLLRTKTQESVVLAKKNLKTILQYQNSDGSFPVLITELNTLTNWAPSFRIVIPLFQIITDFNTILGSDFSSEIEHAYNRLFAWCSDHIQLFQESKKPLYSFVIAIIGMQKSLDRYEAYYSLYEEAIQEIKEKALFFDMNFVGLFASILPENKKELLYESASMFDTDFGYVGPSIYRKQSGFIKGILSGDVALSILSRMPLKIKAEEWPRKTLFSVATLYRLSHFQFSRKSVAQHLHEHWGYVESLSGNRLAWCTKSICNFKKNGPISILSPDIDLVVLGSGYSLVSWDRENEKKFLFQFTCDELISEPEAVKKQDLQQLLLFYLSKESVAFFLHNDGSSATYFHPKENVLVANKERKEDYFVQISIEHSDQDVGGYSFRVRSEERPNQIKVIPQHIIRNRKLSYTPAHDWVLEYVHLEGVRPHSITLVLHFL